jgi:hypothetical protein
MGLQILDIESAIDIGSNSAGLQCKVKTVTTHGETTFTVSTKTINGNAYIEMVPNLSE